jgi:predicted metal-dependent enzyme (double-stranded beta helix superfamily)
MKPRSLLAVTGLVAAAMWASAGTASADPTKAQTLTLVCDNGHTYTVVVNSSGAWSPAHDVNSTSTLIALSFGETTGTVTDANGQVVDSFSEPATVKGSASSHVRGTTAACTYTSDDTFVDPDLGPLHVHVDGSVVGFVTPV